ncbi:MAG: S41 family peptidase [Alphaproteobacteria bacterium]|nr:S41 family peptidase [Alphaproteobacteria bacterium]
MFLRAFSSSLLFVVLLALPACAEQATVAKGGSDAPAKGAVTKGVDSPESDTFKQLSLFADVLERVRADYVEEVGDEKLIESSINGMLSSLDPHSAFLNRKSFAELQTGTKGEFGGLGLEVTMENSLVKVVSPIDGTPAANAGLQSGDFITHIDSKLVAEMTLQEAVESMRGAPGSKVTITVRRGGLSGQPFDVTLTRAVIRVQSVRFHPEGEDIGYIRVTTFNEQTQTGLNKALEELNKKMGDKLTGYVVDLRNNPGGLLEQAVSVAGTFLPTGSEIVSTRGRHSEDNQSYKSKSGDKAGGKPIVVLINTGSASASEIVAGALQDYHRAILVGTKSYGKGSVQTVIPIPGAGAMKLTTALYYTPLGRSIQKLGIEPDIIVNAAKLEEVAPPKGISEADMKGALANPNGDKDKKVAPAPTEDKPADKEDKGEKSEDSKDGKDAKEPKAADKKAEPYDNQLAHAVDLLRGIILYNHKSKLP